MHRYGTYKLTVISLFVPIFVLLVITFVHGTYNYTLQTNNVCRVCSAVAIL
jgi:hypothetical protein